LQGLGLVLRGEVMLQGCREAQVWTCSKQELSMGTNLVTACKVFIKMAAREFLWNFGNLFGASHLYN
jgi:hypothetical protein